MNMYIFYILRERPSLMWSRYP